jgi:peptidoglycan/xylan/chitin deacetylase (PgdA/CDA1 family)
MTMPTTRKDFLRTLTASLAGLGTARLFAQTSAVTPAPVLPIAPESGTFISHGLVEGMKVAVTFDDGPNPRMTPQILTELAKRKIHSTFFLIGRNVKARPELAKAMVEQGHEVANHTFTHPTLSKLSDAAVADELRRGQDTLHAATGVTPNLFRPPYGAFKRTQAALAVREQLDILMWSVDPRDWSQPGVEKIQQTVNMETKPGAIVLLHELHAQTLEALPTLLDDLQGRGFQLVTVSEVLGRKA